MKLDTIIYRCDLTIEYTVISKKLCATAYTMGEVIYIKASYIEVMALLVQERDKEGSNNKQNLLYCNIVTK